MGSASTRAYLPIPMKSFLLHSQNDVVYKNDEGIGVGVLVVLPAHCPSYAKFIGVLAVILFGEVLYLKYVHLLCPCVQPSLHSCTSYYFCLDGLYKK